MSKFLEELQKRNPKTLVEQIEEALDKESLADFIAAVEGGRIPIPAIVATLAEFGIETSPSVIQRWRNTGKPPRGSSRKADK
jgi:hypothetical protein